MIIIFTNFHSFKRKKYDLSVSKYIPQDWGFKNSYQLLDSNRLINEN